MGVELDVQEGIANGRWAMMVEADYVRSKERE